MLLIGLLAVVIMLIPTKRDNTLLRNLVSSKSHVRRIMSINKLDNLTRRLNKAMRTTLLNCDQDELSRLTQTVDLETWESIGRLLRTDVTLHPNYTEKVDT